MVPPSQSRKTIDDFSDQQTHRGPWAKLFAKAVTEFNALSAKHSLGVTFVVGSTAPDPHGYGGADVHWTPSMGPRILLPSIRNIPTGWTATRCRAIPDSFGSEPRDHPGGDTMHPFGLKAPVMPPLVLAAPITLIQNNW
jgi:hypothetical protein